MELYALLRQRRWLREDIEVAKKVRRLGRGLNALISDLEDTTQSAESQKREDAEVCGVGVDRDKKVDAQSSTLRDGVNQEDMGSDSAEERDGIHGGKGRAGKRSQRHVRQDGGSLREKTGDSATAMALQHDHGDDPGSDKSVIDVALARCAVAEKVEDVGVKARMAAVGALRPNRHQPRGVVDDKSVTSLAQSIASNGILQPIVVRDTEDGLEIIVGERRWRAARLAGLERVPVLVREATDEQMLEWALVENIHREDLNAVDRALAYRRYCDLFELTAEQVASRLGEDRTTVTNYVRLLELPEAVRELLAGKRISMGHARALLGVEGDIRKIELATLVAGKELSVRVLEDLVRRERPPRTVTTRRRGRSSGPPDAHIRELEGRFESELQTKVKIHVGPAKGNGRIVIEFFSLDDFDRIARRMGVIVGKGERGEE